MEHLLIGCRHNMLLWKILEKVFSRVFSYFRRLDSKEIILGFWDSGNTQNPYDTLMINMLLGICRYNIWKTRCCIKYGNEIISESHSKNRLKLDIEVHLQVLLLGSVASQQTKETLKSIQANLNQVCSL